MKLEVKNKVLASGIHYLTSDYKTRNENRSSHNGMDLIGPKGVDNIVSMASGTVKYVGYDPNGGYWISILTNGIEHRYFHLAPHSIKVKKGEQVAKGTVIARMGKSGNATNYCLHFAIYNKGYQDPLPFLTEESPFNNTFTTFVKDLQKAIGVPVDGKPGPITLAKTPTLSTSIGWHHAAVRPLQVYLQSLGYNLGKYGVDGKFGNDMKQAIKKYQKDVGLKASYQDGKVTARMYTWQKLLKLR